MPMGERRSFRGFGHQPPGDTTPQRDHNHWFHFYLFCCTLHGMYKQRMSACCSAGEGATVLDGNPSDIRLKTTNVSLLISRQDNG